MMFFDRCGIFECGAFRELHFGFFGEAQELQQGLIVVVSKTVLEAARESLSSDVDNLGKPEMTEMPKCRIRGNGANVVPADIVGLAQTANTEAEILFHTFSSKVAVEMASSGEDEVKITAVCSALLRCEVDLQKRWVIGLYEAA